MNCPCKYERMLKLRGVISQSKDVCQAMATVTGSFPALLAVNGFLKLMVRLFLPLDT